MSKPLTNKLMRIKLSCSDSSELVSVRRSHRWIKEDVKRYTQADRVPPSDSLRAVALAVNLGLKTGVAPSSVRSERDVVWLVHYDVKLVFQALS